MKFSSIGIVLLALFANSSSSPCQESTKPTSIYEHKLKSIEGQTVELSKYKGKVLLIVNVASECGMTPQYAGLQALHEKYKDKGLAILGVPCNQFGGQEPGSEKDIKEFCTANYRVTFDMFSKVDVIGKKATPLFNHLTSVDSKAVKSGPVGWNFEKFLVNRRGTLIGRFDSGTEPDSPELVDAISKSLAE